MDLEDSSEPELRERQESPPVVGPRRTSRVPIERDTMSWDSRSLLLRDMAWPRGFPTPWNAINRTPSPRMNYTPQDGTNDYPFSDLRDSPTSESEMPSLSSEGDFSSEEDEEAGLVEGPMEREPVSILSDNWDTGFHD